MHAALRGKRQGSATTPGGLNQVRGIADLVLRRPREAAWEAYCRTDPAQVAGARRDGGRMDRGSATIADLAEKIERCDMADARITLVHADDSWQVAHGEVTLASASPASVRRWRYQEAMFLQEPVPGKAIAGLLRGERQHIGGLDVSAPQPAGAASFQRLPSQAESRNLTMPWPRTEWNLNAPDQVPAPAGILVGDGPAFVSFDAAYSAFLYTAPPSNLTSNLHLWRIIEPDRRAWLHRVVISPDALTITVKGPSLDGVTVELSTPAGMTARRVGRTGKVRLRLPAGLADSSLLLLRRDGDWLDHRYFHSPVPGRQRDASVVWDQPGADLDILIAGGEGLHVEFKQEVPTTPESRKKALKTIAAFASGEGGTVLFGVTDDARVAGLDPAALDRLGVAVTSMIRDAITPEPPYTLRKAELDGKTLLLAEVSAGGRWYAVNPAKPEFYVRRGASTVPARLEEIAAGFTPHPASTRWG
jgi:hypothetical protein